MAKIIGLTGGIASGKSTVTAFLLEQVNPDIEADAVVHE
ncbi:dephospho-CoA kinase [Streptococcus suis]